MNGLNRWKLIIYLAGIFAAGSVSGWMVGVRTTAEKVFRPFRPEEFAASMKGCIHSKLDLTSDQKVKVDTILDQAAQEMRSVHYAHLKRIGQIVSNRNNQILAVLNLEQRQKFEEIERSREERIHNKSHSRDSRRDRRQNTNCEKPNANKSS